MNRIIVAAAALLCVAALVQEARANHEETTASVGTKSCVVTREQRQYTKRFITEKMYDCLVGGRTQHYDADGKACKCASYTTGKRDMNTYVQSAQDGCVVFQSVPPQYAEVTTGFVAWVANVTTGDTTVKVPPGDKIAISGTAYEINEGRTKYTVTWDDPRPHTCQTVAGYKVRFGSDDHMFTTTNSITKIGRFQTNCRAYTVIITPVNDNNETHGTPGKIASALTHDEIFKLSCCEPPFIKTELGCVYYHECRKTWAESKAICKVYGGDLYEPSSMTDTSLFTNIFKREFPYDKLMWVNVKQTTGGEWKWGVTAREVHDKEWMKGKFPNAEPGYNCGYFYMSRFGPLRNTKCEFKFPFFCKIDIADCA